MAKRTVKRPSDEAMDAWRALLRTHRLLLGRLEADLQREHAMSLDWYDVLFQLSDAGGRLRMNALSDRLLVSRYNCTRLVDRMAKAGLVSREAVAEDRRGTQAVLTAAGKTTLRRAAPTHLAGLARYVDEPLSTAALMELAASLRVLEQHTQAGVED